MVIEDHIGSILTAVAAISLITNTMTIGIIGMVILPGCHFLFLSYVFRFSRNYDYDYKRDREDEKWEKEPSKQDKRGSQQDFSQHGMSRHSSEEWRNDRRSEKYEGDKLPTSDRYDRPQRPDSRDSRASRESRHSRESARDSEPREYHGSWAVDVPFESAYEERRKDYREERRQVPGPITKERVEAEDLKGEKKNLTQLKRGYIPAKLKKEETKEIDNGWNIGRCNFVFNEIGGLTFGL